MSASIIRCALKRLHLDPLTAETCRRREEQNTIASTTPTPTDSIRASPARSADLSDHEELIANAMDHTSGPLLQDDNQHQNDSPASTILVPETPHDNVPAAAAQADPRTRPPTPPIEAATHANNAQEIAHLRHSRAQLVEELKDSTARINRLRTRGRVFEANALATKALLGQADDDRMAAEEAQERTRMVSARLRSVLVVVVVAVVMYAVWCWYKGPEMEYIRKRRAEVLRE